MTVQPLAPAASYHALMLNSLLPQHGELAALARSHANPGFLFALYPFDPMQIFTHIATTVGNMSDDGIDLAQEALLCYSQKDPLVTFMKWYSGDNETAITTGGLDCWLAMFGNAAPANRRELVHTARGRYQNAWSTLYEMLRTFINPYYDGSSWEDEYILNRADVDYLVNMLREVLSYE